MISNFIDYLQFEKRGSAHTVDAYKRDLLQFQDFISHSFELSDLSIAGHSEIRAWIIDLVEQGLSPTSVNRKLATLRSFYKFLLRREHISQDPTYKLKSLKNPKKLPEFVQESSIQDVLASDVYDTGFEGERDKMILEFLYLTGVRLSELIGLQWSDLDIAQMQVRVLGKRKKERVIPLSQSLLSQIISYRKVFEKRFPELGQNSYFIVTNSGKRSYPMMVYRTVRQYLDRFAQTSKRSPHVLRHTFATHLLNKGADINAVKDLLGHTSLAATQVYTHNSMEKLKAVFNQAHPKA